MGSNISVGLFGKQNDVIDDRRVAVVTKREVAELREFIDAVIMGNVDEMNLTIGVTERLWISSPENHTFRRVLRGSVNVSELDVASEITRIVLLHPLRRNDLNRSLHVSDYFRALYF